MILLIKPIHFYDFNELCRFLGQRMTQTAAASQFGLPLSKPFAFSMDGYDIFR